ncbi:MAG TPA: HAD family hydrolase [Phycisphaerales bacterium]|nr:HAD family hydrolase [Phycisphaerales bacterium]
MEFQAILFDVDGTLLDTLADIACAANAGLKALGFATHPLESYRRFVGDGAGCLALRVLPEEHQDDETVERCREIIRAEYVKCWADNTRPYPGVPEMLAELEARCIPMTMLSNKPHPATKRVVEGFFPDYHFRIVRGALPSVPIKPDPAGAIQIAEELGIPPERFVYLGDTNTDMRTAVAAGMFAAGALWGFRTAGELTENGAKVLLKTPLEVVNLFNSKK